MGGGGVVKPTPKLKIFCLVFSLDNLGCLLLLMLAWFRILSSCCFGGFFLVVEDEDDVGLEE